MSALEWLDQQRRIPVPPIMHVMVGPVVLGMDNNVETKNWVVN